MQVKPIEYKYSSNHQYVQLSDSQIADGLKAKAGKVFGGMPRGKSELRAIVNKRENERVEKIRAERQKNGSSL